MSTRLQNLSSNPTLNNYIQGAAKQSVSAVAEFVAPTVPVAKAVGKFKTWNDKTALVVPDTRRALGDEGAMIGFDFSDTNYNCEPHAINTGVDFMEEDESDVVESLVKEGANIAASLGSMSHEKRVLAAMAAGATPGNAIDTTSDGTKVINILNGHLLDVVKGAKGWGDSIELRLLIGASALQKIIDHADVKNRYKTSKRGGGYFSPTLDDLAGMLMLPVNAMVSLMVQDVNANLDAASVDFMLGSKVLVFAAKASPDRHDPSFMKTFRKMGAFMVPRYWSAPSGRQQYAGFDWSEEIKVTNAGASRLCAVT